MPINVAHGLWLSTIIGTIVTGLYWTAFFVIAYGLTAGDPAPGSEGTGTMSPTLAVWVVGLAIYAGLAVVWRRIDFWLAGRST